MHCQCRLAIEERLGTAHLVESTPLLIGFNTSSALKSPFHFVGQYSSEVLN